MEGRKIGRPKISTRRIALTGILSAEAIALSALEMLIPPIPFLPPGAKPGFSNIVTMFAAREYGFGGAIPVALLKSLFVLVTRGPSAFLMSLFGGLLSACAMCLCFRWNRGALGIIGISVLSSVAHDLGQLAAACLLTGTPALYAYLPLLLLFAVAAGILTGIVLAAILPALEKQKKYVSSQ